MIVLFTILVTITVVLLMIGIIKAIKDAFSDYEPWLFFAAIVGFLAIINFMFAFRWQFGTNHYSGYIYSTATNFGYTTAHIRFSQNAGSDAQPSICFEGDEAQKAIELTGTNKKVEIIVESKGPFMANNYFECSGIAKIIKEETNDN